MSVWDDFIATLTLENKLLRELIESGEAKQKQINNAQEVARLAHAEETLVRRLEEVDQKRAVLFDVVAPGQALQEWILTLADEQEEQAVPLIINLAQNLAELQSLNALNQELIEQSLGYVHFSLNLLMGDESAPTYSRPGDKAPGKSIFDRKV